MSGGTKAWWACGYEAPADGRAVRSSFLLRWRTLSWFFVLVLAVGVSRGAPLERDLGQGLRYYRVHALPTDLPPPPPASGKTPPCVVDVRFVHAEEEAAQAFMAWLRFRAKPRAPVFVLANSGTSAALLRELASRERGGGVMLIGVPGRALEPDIVVKTTSADEKRAYEAMEKDEASVAALITDNPDKVRNDEASFSRDRLAEASADSTADAVGAKRTPPPIDAALQRAVHLHRALVALRKL